MHELIAKAKREDRNLLEHESLALFAEYGIPGPRFALVTNVEEAKAAAEKIGYPVVLKIVSPDIIHKSDVGGVQVGMKTPEEVGAAFQQIMDHVAKKAQDARIHGILVLSLAKAGVECIVGMTKDPSFGPAIMFGLGGIFVELLKDVSFRVLPLDAAEVRAMIQETKGYKLLAGARGQGPKDIEALVGLILNVAKMIEENPEIEELDINPLFVYDQGVCTVDARILL